MSNKPKLRRASVTEEEYARLMAERELARAHAETYNRALDDLVGKACKSIHLGSDAVEALVQIALELRRFT